MRGRILLTSKYRRALHRAKAMLLADYDGELMAGPLELVAIFHMPDLRRRDPTNYLKIICDSLVGTVIEDDNWKCLGRVVIECQHVDRENPRVNLHIINLEGT